MRVVATALALSLFALAARADTGAGDLQPETRALLDAWLAAQNRGDFAAYEKLYAHKLTGVRRSGPRTVSLDRAGWMRDRQRMFQKPMKVTASEIRIVGTPASARVTFTQEWESGSYHDRGPKQLVVVREEGAARIAREEMLSSEKSAPASVTEAAFVLVIGRYAILDPDNGEQWATGATRIDDESEPLITSRRATGVPPELAAFVGKKLIVQSPGAASCTATVKELRVVGLVVPHVGMREDWREQHRSARQRADEAWELSAKVLGATLDGCTPTAPAFARAADLPPLPLVLPAAESRLRAAAIAGLRKLPSWRALQKAYVEQGHKGKWDVGATGAKVEVQRWELPDGPLVTVSAHGQAGCADFGGELFAVFRPKPDGSLAFVAEPTPLRPAAALLIDGAPAFFGTQSWTDFATAVQLVPVRGEPRKLSVPYLDCPC